MRFVIDFSSQRITIPNEPRKGMAGMTHETAG